MPSPILHTAAGFAAALLLHRRRPATSLLPLAAVSVVVSSLPDLDYLPGLATGSLNAFHQGPTHSLAAVLAAALLLSAIPPLRRFAGLPRYHPFFLYSLALLLLHLLFDAFTQDFRPPIGIPLFWPFSDAPVHASFSPFLFPAWSKMALSDLFTATNLRPALSELLAALALLLPAALLRPHAPPK
ncbi:MAG: metal-dependent hydrolase [Kiritimatiellae bacterium]|nr:metal-dependent hydrolase [Kiritimatiellia bacterium]